MIDQKQFWNNVRAKNYHKLSWINESDYINKILNIASIEKEHLALDLGCGTGVMAMAMRKKTNRVLAVDLSEEMIKNFAVPDVNVLQWDMKEPLFADNLFDRIVARMVLHNVTQDIDKLIENTYRILKPGGKFIIAEGTPPTDDPETVQWYTEMFKLKEERLVFTESDLVQLLKRHHFKSFETEIHYMDDFNINNWLENSGCDKKTQDDILNLHINMNDRMKNIYHLKEVSNNWHIRTNNIILSGQK